MVVTLKERKAMALARLRRASAACQDALRAYARERQGRFVVFGSFARGDIAPSSDFDVLVEFPPVLEREARAFVEATCGQVGLVPDVHLASETSEPLMSRVRRDGIVLP